MVLVDGVGGTYKYQVDSGRTIIAGGTLRDWAPGCGGPSFSKRHANDAATPRVIERPGA